MLSCFLPYASVIKGHVKFSNQNIFVILNHFIYMHDLVFFFLSLLGIHHVGTCEHFSGPCKIILYQQLTFFLQHWIGIPEECMVIVFIQRYVYSM